MISLPKKYQEFNGALVVLLKECNSTFKVLLDKIEEQPDLIGHFSVDIITNQYEFCTTLQKGSTYRFAPVEIRQLVSGQLDFVQQLDTKLNLNLFPVSNFKTIYGTLDVRTCKQGELQISFERLVEVFGQPWYYTDEPGDKSDVEWPLLFDDGTVATIYNYKNGKNYAIYSDGDGEEIEDIFDWSIGGNCPEAATLVKTEIATFKFQN